jgi:hypothetical protein
MESPIHRIGDLFRQLGLPDEPAAIEAFLTEHRPQPGDVLLADLAMWTPSQAAFLREEIAKDSDWSELVDVCGALLSH